MNPPSDVRDLKARYGWEIAANGRWTPAELSALTAAGAALATWLMRFTGDFEAACARIRGIWGGTEFRRANALGRLLGRNHVEADRIYLLDNWSQPGVPDRTPLRNVPIHELAHVLDNATLSPQRVRLPWLLSDAALYGGGVSDAMATYLGGDPDRCPLRFFCPGRWYTGYREAPPTAYARMGPSEDFAETFMLAVAFPHLLPAGGPRDVFMRDLLVALVRAESVRAAAHWLHASRSSGTP